MCLDLVAFTHTCLCRYYFHFDWVFIAFGRWWTIAELLFTFLLHIFQLHMAGFHALCLQKIQGARERHILIWRWLEVHQCFYFVINFEFCCLPAFDGEQSPVICEHLMMNKSAVIYMHLMVNRSVWTYNALIFCQSQQHEVVQQHCPRC